MFASILDWMRDRIYWTEDKLDWTLDKLVNIGAYLGFLWSWQSVLTAISALVAVVGLTVEMEDRQSERVFRAWNVVSTTSEYARADPPSRRYRLFGSSQLREAMQYLNRKFRGAVCNRLVIPPISFLLTGNSERICLFPKKERETLSSLNIPFSDLSGVRLPEANLTGSILNGADLRNAELEGAQLCFVEMRTADLTAAQLSNAVLWEADLSSADAGSYFVTSLREAEIKNADLRRANLRGTDLRDANLEGSDLRDVEVEGDAFFGVLYTKWHGANLMEADLRGVTGLTCNQLTSANNWEMSYRDDDLLCGKERPAKKKQKTRNTVRRTCIPIQER